MVLLTVVGLTSTVLTSVTVPTIVEMRVWGGSVLVIMTVCVIGSAPTEAARTVVSVSVIV
jgi:hypothetical protein